MEKYWLYARSQNGAPAALAALASDLPVDGSTRCIFHAFDSPSMMYSLSFFVSRVTEIREVSKALSLVQVL